MIGSWQTTLIVGFVTLILGLVVSFHPSGSLNVIAVMIGLLMLISGLFHLIRMFSGAEAHRLWLGISGLLLIVLGVILIRHLHLTVAVIGLTVGIGWIVQGLSAVAVAFAGDGQVSRGWWLFFGIVSVIGGIVITAVPVGSVTALAVLVGIWFIVEGLFEMVQALVVRNLINKSQPTIAGAPRTGQGAVTQ